MALAMVQFCLKSETVGKLIQNPEDRSIAVGKLVEQLGGKLLSFYYTFDEYDGIIIVDMPDNIAIAATSIVAFAGGGVTKIKTTILVSVKEAMAAMAKGKGLKLAQPKG
jgi:uncharacterized protein with GYD domain